MKEREHNDGGLLHEGNVFQANTLGLDRMGFPMSRKSFTAAVRIRYY